MSLAESRVLAKSIEVKESNMRTRKDIFPPDLQPGRPRDSDTPEIIKENGGGVSTRRQLMEKLRSEKMRSNKIQEALGGGGAVKRRRQEEEEAGRNLAGVSHTSGKAVNTLNVRGITQTSMA